MKDICDVKPGETLVVSGAAGSVGSLACQLGKRWGAKVIAIAGSQEKCDWLVNEIGVDVALNYKSESFAKDFKNLDYVNAYFDNVGGKNRASFAHRLHAQVANRGDPRSRLDASGSECTDCSMWCHLRL